MSRSASRNRSAARSCIISAAAKTVRTLTRSGNLLAAAAAISLIPAPASSGEAPPLSWPKALRGQIVRLTEVGYRLNAAASPLCPRQAAATGITVDYIEAYPQASRALVSAELAMGGAPQVAAVAPGSPAQAAGVRAGDAILAIDGVTSTAMAAASPQPALLADQIEDRLAATPQGRRIALVLERDGAQVPVTIDPVQSCAARFLVKPEAGMNGFSDGINVALGSRLIAFARSDDEIAVVAGHELAHVVNADGDAGGLNRRRAMEDRADVLGTALARCAGYDVERGLDIWRRFRKTDVFGFLAVPEHRGWKARIANMQAQSLTGPCPPSRGLAKAPQS
ncbi:PDZ domain-containing protein [Novosphingobium colocasiae]|uniref:PDZ domain-containing protein n=1 Tax=Novosphingobium colocasiae TaxID=1256513 RepID=UPI0035B14365